MKTAHRGWLALAICLALLPGLAGAQPPPPQGKLVYQDDFSDGTKSGLEDNLNATDYSRGFHPPGVYHLLLNENNETRWSTFPDQRYSTFTIEVDVWDNSDTFSGDVAQGLIFRARDNNHFYVVLVDPREARYAVRKLDGRDRWTDLVPWKDSSIVKTQAEVNRLRVDGKGDSFTVYLNNETLTTFRDASYETGSIGLLATNFDAVEPHMHFDNMRVYTTDTDAPSLPAALPTTGGGADLPPLLLVLLALLSLAVGARLRAARG